MEDKDKVDDGPEKKEQEEEAVVEKILSDFEVVTTDDSFVPEIPVIKPIMENWDEIKDVDQMNQLLMTIG